MFFRKEKKIQLSHTIFYPLFKKFIIIILNAEITKTKILYFHYLFFVLSRALISDSLRFV